MPSLRSLLRQLPSDDRDVRLDSFVTICELFLILQEKSKVVTVATARLGETDSALLDVTTSHDEHWLVMIKNHDPSRWVTVADLRRLQQACASTRTVKPVIVAGTDRIGKTARERAAALGCQLVLLSDLVAAPINWPETLSQLRTETDRRLLSLRFARTFCDYLKGQGFVTAIPAPDIKKDLGIRAGRMAQKVLLEVFAHALGAAFHTEVHAPEAEGSAPLTSKVIKGLSPYLNLCQAFAYRAENENLFLLISGDDFDTESIEMMFRQLLSSSKSLDKAVPSSTVTVMPLIAYFVPSRFQAAIAAIPEDAYVGGFWAKGHLRAAFLDVSACRVVWAPSKKPRSDDRVPFGDENLREIVQAVNAQ